MKEELSIFLAFVVALVSLYLYVFTDSPAKSEASIVLARDAAMGYLQNPSKNNIKIVGDKSLLEGCTLPTLEKTFALSEKGRFEFRLLCEKKETAFILVFMREAPPDFMVISKSGYFE